MLRAAEVRLIEKCSVICGKPCIWKPRSFGGYSEETVEFP